MQLSPSSSSRGTRRCADDRFSYPFDAGWFTTAQVVFAVQHAAMLPLFAGLLLLERRRPSRALRIGTWIALVGQVLLTVIELVAITARRRRARRRAGAPWSAACTACR